MRLPRFFFTVRGLMVAVGILSLVIYASVLRERSQRLAIAAARYRRLERFYRAEPGRRARSLAASAERWSLDPGLFAPAAPGVPAHFTWASMALAEHHARRALDCERAAAAPWRGAPHPAPEPDWDAMMERWAPSRYDWYSKPEPD